jgi:hypothetical protein
MQKNEMLPKATKNVAIWYFVWNNVIQDGILRLRKPSRDCGDYRGKRHERKYRAYPVVTDTHYP